jgi:hypothetical protein
VKRRAASEKENDVCLSTRSTRSRAIIVETPVARPNHVAHTPLQQTPFLRGTQQVCPRSAASAALRLTLYLAAKPTWKHTLRARACSAPHIHAQLPLT